MTASRFERALDWFERLKDLPAEERVRALASLPSEERELEPLIRELFDGDERPLEALDRPAAAHVGLLDETVPARIGPFEILERVASGGMGVVYKARRDFPERIVALKRVAADLDRPESRRRFEHEVQILARLTHPSIARIYEAGVADAPTGPIPYLAMELIEGTPLTEGAVRAGLGVAARIELLAVVCDAVEYAHRKEVVHCDLKPDNVLLDSEGRPHVLDFGIARLVRGGETLLAEPKRGGGTPGFMSPEQFAGGEPVPAWDVFALGVLGFELFGVEFDPEEPVELGAPARGTRFAEDLSWILLSATHPDGGHRWRSAGAMAEALRQCGASRPIPDAQPGRLRRLRLFVRRNRLLVTLATLVQLAILGGTLGTLLQGKRAVHAAEAARDQAAKKQDAFDFLRAMIALAQPEENRGHEYTLRELLERAEAFLPEIVADAESRAIVQGFLGNAYASLGRVGPAERCLEAAHATFVAELGKGDPATLQAGLDLGALRAQLGKREVAEGLLASILAELETRATEDPLRLRAEFELGSALVLSAQWARAEQYLERALAGRRRLYGDGHEETLAVLNALGFLRCDQQRFEEAEMLFNEALAGLRRVLGVDHPKTLTTLNNLATLHAELENYDKALPLLREELEQTERVQGPDHPSTLLSRMNVALTRAYLGEHGEALSELDEVTADCARLLEPDHPLQFQVQHDLAEVLVLQGEWEPAELAIRAALEGRLRVLGEAHPQTLRSLDSLADLLAKSRRHAEAVRELVAGLAAVREDRAADTEFSLVAKLLDDLGSYLLTLGRPAEALPVLREAAALGVPGEEARNRRLLEAAEQRAAASK